MNELAIKIIKKLTTISEGSGLGKIKPLFNLYVFVLSLFKPEFIVTRGGKIYLDRNDSLLLSVYPVFEPGMTKVVEKYVKPGMIVCDVGANIGYFTLLFSKLVGKKGKVYAFEPDRENLKLLRKNVKANDLTNVKIVPFAISEKNGYEKLYISRDNPQDNRIIIYPGEVKEVRKVKSFTLDSYFKNKKLDFIKLDIQGAEPKAFLGASKVLANKNLRMVFEFWPWAINNFSKNPDSILNFLRKKGKIKTINQLSGELSDLNKSEISSNLKDKDFILELMYTSKK